MLEKIKKENHSDWWLGTKAYIFISVLLVILVMLVYFVLHYALHWWDLNSRREDSNVLEIHFVSLILLTIGLITVAYVQLKKSNENLRGEFLLEIDRRFASSEIAKAEMVIQALCWQYSIKDVNDPNIQQVSKAIRQIVENKSNLDVVVNSEKAVYLINFLDFLETIAYFRNENLVSTDDIEKTLGGTLCYYHTIFKDLIEHQRAYLNKQDYYGALEKVVKEINLSLTK